MAYLKTAVTRFLQKVPANGRDDCWIWMGAIRPNGYSSFYLAGKVGYGHRAAYELFVGSIPPGMDIDHLCRNRSCVNPAHLEAVTRRENLRRGEGCKPWPVCIRGHRLSDENVVIIQNGSGPARRCRICLEAWRRAYLPRRRELRRRARAKPP